MFAVCSTGTRPLGQAIFGTWTRHSTPGHMPNLRAAGRLMPVAQASDGVPLCPFLGGQFEKIGGDRPPEFPWRASILPIMAALLLDPQRYAPYSPLGSGLDRYPPQLLVVGPERHIGRPWVAIQRLIAGARRCKHREKHHDQCELPRRMSDRQTHPPSRLAFSPQRDQTYPCTAQRSGDQSGTP